LRALIKHEEKLNVIFAQSGSSRFPHCCFYQIDLLVIHSIHIIHLYDALQSQTQTLEFGVQGHSLSSSLFSTFFLHILLTYNYTSHCSVYTASQFLSFPTCHTVLSFRGHHLTHIFTRLNSTSILTLNSNVTTSQMKRTFLTNCHSTSL
jgi:hypothetical protein